MLGTFPYFQASKNRWFLAFLQQLSTQFSTLKAHKTKIHTETAPTNQLIHASICNLGTITSAQQMSPFYQGTVFLQLKWKQKLACEDERCL